MLFSYRARDERGREIKDEQEASDKFALAEELRRRGWVVVEATSRKEKPAGFKFFAGRVRLRDKIILAGNLAAMIEAGLTLTRALSVVERQANGYLKTVVRALGQRINRGESLTKALENFPAVFPPLFTAMVAAGEEAGKLPESLRLITEQMQKSYDLRRKIRGALIYPAIILFLIVAVGALMMIFVVPTLAATFQDLNIDLPLSTRFLIGLSNFLAHHYLGVAISLLGLIAGLFWALRASWGQRALAWLVLRLPIVALIAKKANAALLLRTLGSLLSSGVSMVESLKITGRVVQNSYYQESIAAAVRRVEKGEPLSATFMADSRLYPVMVGEMMAVGEETGKLSDMLFRGAVFFEAEVDQATKNLSTLLEPVLMVLIGVAVGFFAVSIIAPIYSLSTAF